MWLLQNSKEHELSAMYNLTILSYDTAQCKQILQASESLGIGAKRQLNEESVHLTSEKVKVAYSSELWYFMDALTIPSYVW